MEIQFLKQPNPISLCSGFNYFTLQFLGFGNVTTCQFDADDVRDGGWETSFFLEFDSGKSLRLNVRLVLISNGVIGDRDTLDNWFSAPIFTFGNENVIPSSIITENCVIDYWFRIDKMPINGYQFGFDFYPQIENVVIEPFSSDLFTAYEFCEVLCYDSLFDKENPYPSYIQAPVSEGVKSNEKNMDSVLCGEDIIFQVINFAPSSSYFIGNYKLPVISENEEKGEVICKSPATPPGAESSYKLAVFIEEDINSPTDAHCGALSFGPLNIAYHYGNVNINKLFSLLGDGIGFFGQESILIEMSTMTQWENVQNVSDFDELFAKKLIPVSDLQIFFLDALTLAINDLHVDVEQLRGVYNHLTIAHYVSFMGWIDVLMFLILDLQIRVDLTLYYQLLDCAVMGGFDGTISFLLSQRDIIEEFQVNAEFAPVSQIDIPNIKIASIPPTSSPLSSPKSPNTIRNNDEVTERKTSKPNIEDIWGKKNTSNTSNTNATTTSSESCSTEKVDPIIRSASSHIQRHSLMQKRVKQDSRTSLILAEETSVQSSTDNEPKKDPNEKPAFVSIHSALIKDDAKNWIPEQGINPGIFLMFFPNPNYTKISRRVTENITLLEELSLVCEKRQQQVSSFEAYSFSGDSINPTTLVSKIEGQCVFLVDISEKKQDTPQKRVPKKSISQTQRNNQDFVGEKRRSVMLTPEQMREFNAGGASSSRLKKKNADAGEKKSLMVLMRQQSSKKLSVGSQSKDGKSGTTNMKNADDKRKEISTNTKVGGTRSENGKGGSKNEVSLNFKRPSDETDKSPRGDGTASREINKDDTPSKEESSSSRTDKKSHKDDIKRKPSRKTLDKDDAKSPSKDELSKKPSRKNLSDNSKNDGLKSKSSSSRNLKEKTGDGENTTTKPESSKSPRSTKDDLKAKKLKRNAETKDDLKLRSVKDDSRKIKETNEKVMSQSVSIRGKSSKGTVNGLFDEKQGASATSQSSPSLTRKPLSPISFDKLPPNETNNNNVDSINNNTKKSPQSKNLNQINFLSPRLAQKKTDQQTKDTPSENNKIFEELEQELDVEFQTGTFSKSNSSLSLNSSQPIPKTSTVATNPTNKTQNGAHSDKDDNIIDNKLSAAIDDIYNELDDDDDNNNASSIFQQQVDKNTLCKDRNCDFKQIFKDISPEIESELSLQQFTVLDFQNLLKIDKIINFNLHYILTHYGPMERGYNFYYHRDRQFIERVPLFESRQSVKPVVKSKDAQFFRTSVNMDSTSESTYTKSKQLNPRFLEFPEFVAERSVRGPVAIKEIKISPHTLPMVISIIKAMKTCSSCNEVLHDYVDAVKTSSGNIWIITEYQESAYLSDLLDSKPSFTEPHILRISLEILKGLTHLHRLDIMHNNLHAGSVILNKRTGQIKLTNLEYSRNMKAEDTDKDFESLLSVISPYLIAPEVLQNNFYQDRWTFPVDVWCYGLLCIQIVTGRHPYEDFMPFRAMVEITKATPIDLIKLMTPFISSISKDYISLIKGALEIDGTTRPTCVQLIVENKEYFKTKVSTPDNFKQWLNEELIGS